MKINSNSTIAVYNNTYIMHLIIRQEFRMCMATLSMIYISNFIYSILQSRIMVIRVSFYSGWFCSNGAVASSQRNFWVTYRYFERNIYWQWCRGIYWYICNPDNKIHGANMGPTWVLSAPDGPHVGPMNLAIRVIWQDLKAHKGGKYGDTALQSVTMIHRLWSRHDK